MRNNNSPFAAGFCFGVVATLNKQTPKGFLTPPQGVTIASLARNYQISPQLLANYRDRHGFTIAELANPETVFNRLLESGNSSKLRRRLSDPATRQLISQRIQAIL